jgi:3-methyladenine DNA glycosylase Mpg
LTGGELFFENGVKNPIIHDPTLREFFTRSFQHVSSTILWTKISYYLFKKIISGFNIQVGPTVGYSYRSSEERASRSVNILGKSTRLSTLYFNKGFTYGYRISTDIKFDLTSDVLTGFRLDFSNNNEAE